MAVRELPNNLEAEQAVLGSMFLSKAALEKAVEILKETSFYSEKNGKIFSALKSLDERKIPIDITTLTEELKNKNLINAIGGVEYLTEVLDSVPNAANIDYYIKIIEDKATLRELIERATEITTMGYNEENSVNETIEEAEKKILGIIQLRLSVVELVEMLVLVEQH